MKDKGNMYPGVVTWNMLGGECPHRCGYCSTKSLMRYPVIKAKYSGPLTLDLTKKIPCEDKTVFVCGQNDLFADAVSSDWIKSVLDKCRFKDNTYLFQSKNPRRFIEFLDYFPAETILCTTIETNRFYPEHMGKTPYPFDRAEAMSLIYEFTKKVTVEPVIDFDLTEMVELIKRADPVSVNLGADSKHHHLPEPSKDKLLALIDELKKFTVIDKKSNLERLLK